MKVTIRGASLLEINKYSGHYIFAYRWAPNLHPAELAERIETASIDAWSAGTSANAICTRVAIQGFLDYRDGNLPAVPIVPYSLRASSGDPTLG